MPGPWAGGPLKMVRKNSAVRSQWEKKRRMEFNTLLEELRDLVPSITDPENISKSDLLDHAVRYLLHLDNSEYLPELDRVAFETVEDLMLLLSPEGTIKYVTPSCLKILGHEPGGLCGRSVFELMQEDQHDAFRGLLSLEPQQDGTATISLDLGPESQSDEYGSGPSRLMHLRSRVVESEEKAYVLVVGRDPARINDSESDSRETTFPMKEEAVEESQSGDRPKEWPQWELTLTREALITSVDEEMAAALGISAADMVGKSGYMYVHPDDVTISMETHRAVVNYNQNMTQAKFPKLRLMHKNGSYIWAHCIDVAELGNKVYYDGGDKQYRLTIARTTPPEPESTPETQPGSLQDLPKKRGRGRGSIRKPKQTTQEGIGRGRRRSESLGGRRKSPTVAKTNSTPIISPSFPTDGPGMGVDSWSSGSFPGQRAFSFQQPAGDHGNTSRPGSTGHASDQPGMGLNTKSEPWQDTSSVSNQDPTRPMFSRSMSVPQDDSSMWDDVSLRQRAFLAGHRKETVKEEMTTPRPHQLSQDDRMDLDMTSAFPLAAKNSMQGLGHIMDIASPVVATQQNNRFESGQVRPSFSNRDTRPDIAGLARVRTPQAPLAPNLVTKNEHSILDTIGQILSQSNEALPNPNSGSVRAPSTGSPGSWASSLHHEMGPVMFSTPGGLFCAPQSGQQSGHGPTPNSSGPVQRSPFGFGLPGTRGFQPEPRPRNTIDLGFRAGPVQNRNLAMTEDELQHALNLIAALEAGQMKKSPSGF
eukprot:comp20231_c0_seq1/m.25213 comp20231_c0_seq1/g.25213  ORF comp20231_c0_seq1/g.25213 comp20231_c0_seq1/m.25213 type:complete len:759 (-) comp20231_c0_seq1:123-2399(-)